MRERIISAENANYVAREWDGVNRSGFRPIGDLVVVLPDQAAETIGTKGLVLATTTQQNTMSLASESGTLIAVGAGAFAWNSDRSRPFAGEKPKPGDRVIFARYGGRGRKGKDGITYLFMTDNAISGIEDDLFATEEALGEDQLPIGPSSMENLNG
jgi:co-chaperonin GroES (HSP10)